MWRQFAYVRNDLIIKKTPLPKLDLNPKSNSEVRRPVQMAELKSVRRDLRM